MSLHTGSSVRQFPESDTTSSTTEGSESSNGTETQSQSQSCVKPFGSAAARFKIRSANTLTTKDLRKKSFPSESGKIDDSSQKSDPSKDLNRVHTSSGSYTHTNTGDKNTGRTLSKDAHKDSTLPISSERGDVSSDKKLNTPEDKSQQVTANDRSRADVLRTYYSTNKSKSLDWRGTGSRAGDANRTGGTSGNRDFDHFKKQSESLERTGTNKITPQENQSSSVSWRIQAYKPVNQGDQNSDKKVSLASGTTSVKINQVTFSLERANSGQSLPTRLKPRVRQGSVGDGLWPEQQGESSFNQTDNKTVSWAREQGHSNTEEVSGNQTIKERIKKLFGADAKFDAPPKTSIRVKRSNTLSSDQSLPMDTVNSTPSHRKYTTDSVFGTSSDSSDSQQGKPSYNSNKAGTFPRGFSTTYFGPKQEHSYEENRNDQNDTSSGSHFSAPAKPKGSTEMSSVKKIQSLLPDDNEEKTKRWITGSQEYNSQSLDRTRSRQSATAQYNARKNQTASSDSSSGISSQGFKNLLTNTGGIKEEIRTDKQSDKETAKRFDIIENKYLGGSRNVITQPKHPLPSTGAARKEIHKEEDNDDVFMFKSEGRRGEIHKEEEKDNVFMFKSEGRRGEGVLEKLRVPSLDSVRNTISMFESLAQQSKSAPQIPRRAFSVPEHPKPDNFVKKSNSESNFGKVVGNTESIGTNFLSKSDTKKETEGTLDLSTTPYSNSTVKSRSTLEQRQETYKKAADIDPFKQMSDSRADQVINKREEDKKRTVNKKYPNDANIDIPDSSGFRNNGAMEEKARYPVSHQPIVSLFKQQTTEVKIGDDDENTPTNSPDRTPATIIIQPQSNTEATKVNGTNPKVPSNLYASLTPVQTIYSSLNYSNNNNHNTRNDLTTPTTRMARWSSDEEDFDDEETDTEEDSDSGESSVTITSNRSQSDRKSFSLSLVDLCNYGGVEFRELSEDYEELPCSRSASLSSDISAFSSVTLLSNEELDRLLDDVKGLGDDTIKKYEDVQVVVLHKEVGSGLGFTLAGGVDQNKPVTVHRIIPDGIAAQEGSIFEGAQVLSINGTSLQDSAHWEALRTLRKAKGQAMAVVVLQSANTRKEATERKGVTGRRVRVTLNKSSSDLGFSLEGGVGSSTGDRPLIVQKIFRGGPVSDVFPGDELLEVQGRSLAGMMRLEAWNLIKKLPSGPVEVLLHRPQQPR